MRQTRRPMFPLLVLAGIAFAAVALSCAVTQPTLGGVTIRQSPEVDPARLEEHVRRLAIDFHPRSWEDLENLERTAAYIEAELRNTTDDVTSQHFDTSYGDPHRNVIARFGPDTGDRIVIGAHFDSALQLPGADDNASGVAGLIELARLLKDHPPKSRVELVAWTLEEPPVFRTADMGSARHAAMLAKEGAKVRVAISLEMLGAFSDEPGSQSFPAPLMKLFYPDRGNFIAVVGGFGHGKIVRDIKQAMQGASDLPVYSMNAPRFVPGVDFSDHASYWEQGYDAVMITDTAFFRNERYHTAEDTPETLDYVRMAKVVQGVFAAVQALSSN